MYGQLCKSAAVCVVIEVMQKPMKLRYLSKNNGYWVYERRVPKKLIGHPIWKGKSKYTKPLNLKVGSPEQDVIDAWTEQDNLFADTVQHVSDRNIHILSKRDLIEKAKKHLKVHGLEVGGVSTAGMNSAEAQHADAYKHHVLDTEEAFRVSWEWEQEEARRRRKSPYPDELPKIGDEVPAQVQIEREAWTLWNADTNIKAPLLFGDCWDIYADGKQLDMGLSANKKSKRRWEGFLGLAGDEVLTPDSINKALRDWVKAQSGRVNKITGEPLKAETISREFKIVSAVLNYVARERDPNLTWRNPDLQLGRFEIAYERLIIPKDYLRALYQSVQDESLRRHQPWKEFMLTVMCQSGMIPSEFLRLERSNIHLDKEVPYLHLFEQTTKKQSRKRIVPVPFKTERLRQLLDEMDEGQASLFPPSIVVKRGRSYDWATSSSNVNKQINRWLGKYDDEEHHYTSYCLRHSFKHYLHAHDANGMDVLYLAGWYGDDDKKARIMKDYARSGLETPEILIRLERAVKRAVGFLEGTPSDNVLTFASKAK